MSDMQDELRGLHDRISKRREELEAERAKRADTESRLAVLEARVAFHAKLLWAVLGLVVASISKMFVTSTIGG